MITHAASPLSFSPQLSVSVFEPGQGSAPPRTHKHTTHTHPHTHTHKHTQRQQRGEVKDNVLLELTTTTLVAVSAIKPLQVKCQ